VTLELEGADGRQRPAVLEVGAERARLTEPGVLFEGLGFEPWQPPAVVGSVEESSAASSAGILEGDRIVEIDGSPIASFADLQRVVAARPGETVAVRLIRNGAQQRFDVTLGSRVVDGQPAGFLGLGIDRAAGDHWHVRKFGPIAAIVAAIERTWNSTRFTVRMLASMVIGDVSIKNISGPLNIAQYAGDSAAAGLNAFLTFLALVSISLGVLNLLPVPILDGGQIVYQIVELIKGSPLSDRSQMVGQQVGILALLLLMSFAFYNDIARILNQ
jgi:regulator of sigma E protease